MKHKPNQKTFKILGALLAILLLATVLIGVVLKQKAKNAGLSPERQRYMAYDQVKLGEEAIPGTDYSKKE